MEDYNEYYIQGSDHYLIPKDEFKELFNEMVNWKEQSQKLNGAIQTYDILLKSNAEENKQLKEKLNCDLQWAFKYEKQVDNWNKIKEDLIKIRQLTFTKYNKNEWENCLSFNDDIEPILDKMKELEGSDSNVED
jgi:hypothetical protein